MKARPTRLSDPSGDRLLARTEKSYDKLGRVYKTVTHEVDPDDGSPRGQRKWGRVLCRCVFFDESVS